VFCEYLGFNTVAIQRQLVGIPSLIMEMEGIKHICTWSCIMHIPKVPPVLTEEALATTIPLYIVLIYARFMLYKKIEFILLFRWLTYAYVI
jgi:hypothetical protein